MKEHCKNTTVTIGLVQLSNTHSIPSNIENHIQAVRNAAADGAQVIVLQELFSSLYFCDVEDPARFDLAEAVPGPTTDLFSPIAAELGVVLILSLFEKRAPGLYHNTAAVIDADGSYVGKYRKMHIPDDPGYYEKYYFTPGDLGYQVFPTRYGNVGVLICWDQWYPEAARLTAMAGADFLVYPTAIGWAKDEPASDHEEQLDAWITMQRSHAIANGIPVIAVNRVGTEGGQQFWGNSFVCNGYGRILKRLDNKTEEVAVVSLDLKETARYRRVWPFFRDRRVDSYGDITLKWKN